MAQEGRAIHLEPRRVNPSLIPFQKIRVARVGPGVRERGQGRQWRVSTGARGPTYPWCGAGPWNHHGFQAGHVRRRVRSTAVVKRQPCYARKGRQGFDHGCRQAIHGFGLRLRIPGPALATPRWVLHEARCYKETDFRAAALEQDTEGARQALGKLSVKWAMVGGDRGYHRNRDLLAGTGPALRRLWRFA